jgi:hypothetical protein
MYHLGKKTNKYKRMEECLDSYHFDRFDQQDMYHLGKKTNKHKRMEGVVPDSYHFDRMLPGDRYPLGKMMNIDKLSLDKCHFGNSVRRDKYHSDRKGNKNKLYWAWLFLSCVR